MVRSGFRPLAFVVTAASVLGVLPAAAEEARFPVERFRPAIDGSGVIDVDSGAVGEHLDWTVGAFANYALNPLVLVGDDGRGPSLVAHRIGANLIGAVSLFEWVQLGVDAPLLVFQTRDTNGIADVVTGAEDINAVGVGDLRLLAKVRILRAADQFVDLALIPAITVPVSSFAGVSGSYVGEEQITFAPEVAVSKNFDESGQGLRLAANLGYRLRPEERQVVNMTIGHELTYRAGARYHFPETAFAVEGSANGGTYAFAPFSSGFEENPLEVLGGVTYDPLPFLRVSGGLGKGILSGFGTPDFRVLAGVRLIPVKDDDNDDDGIKNADDACKDEPEDKDGFEDQNGCPDPDNDQDGINDVDDGCVDVAEDKDGDRDTDGCPEDWGDADGDGLTDNVDKCKDAAEDKDGFEDEDGCPDTDDDKDGVVDTADKVAERSCRLEPEDKDGFEDGDGCPDPDNDKDGIKDVDDKCKNEPEVINGVDDDDGCPDQGKTIVKLTREKIEILDKVYFDVNKDTIQSRSFNLLNQVSSILKAHPELTKVRIEGHTDADGSDASNLDLSDRRAKAVKRYLEERDVDGGRLLGIGYGESRPVVPNTSKKNKEQNRRVEFVIVEVDGKPADSATDIRSPQ
jgi:outer membrane protein OmpA-like peptidoglycan-associated protein